MRPPSWTQGTMRPRLVMLLSFAVAAVAIAFTGARFTIIAFASFACTLVAPASC